MKRVSKRRSESFLDIEPMDRRVLHVRFLFGYGTAPVPVGRCDVLAFIALANSGSMQIV